MLDLGFLPPDARTEAGRMGSGLSEIRLRAGRPIQLVSTAGWDVLFGRLDVAAFRETVRFLMGYSLYACEDELAKGYFALPDGSRAGVSGAFASESGRVKSISEICSLCIRVAREVRGCAEGIIEEVDSASGCLIVSPPGMGKTTILRDIARLLSGRGRRVCIADERGEIAACAGGVPRLDVGERTDVYALIPKTQSIPMAVRACAPEVIVTDELGAPGDAQAVLDAVRCGVKVVASAHGSALSPDLMKAGVAEAARAGAFSMGVLLGPRVGGIARVVRLGEPAADIERLGSQHDIGKSTSAFQSAPAAAGASDSGRTEGSGSRWYSG